ncbi:hypothetical protein HDU76_010366, partial [Blyttiomyces sp. JEL0837]
AHVEGQLKFYDAAQTRFDQANKAVGLLWDLYPKYLLEKANMKTQSVKEIIEAIRHTFETTEGKHQARQQWSDDWGRLKLINEAKKNPTSIMKFTTKMTKLLRQAVELGDEGKSKESLLADAISKFKMNQPELPPFYPVMNKIYAGNDGFKDLDDFISTLQGAEAAMRETEAVKGTTIKNEEPRNVRHPGRKPARPRTESDEAFNVKNKPKGKMGDCTLHGKDTHPDSQCTNWFNPNGPNYRPELKKKETQEPPKGTKGDKAQQQQKNYRANQVETHDAMDTDENPLCEICDLRHEEDKCVMFAKAMTFYKKAKVAVATASAAGKSDPKIIATAKIVTELDTLSISQPESFISIEQALTNNGDLDNCEFNLKQILDSGCTACITPDKADFVRGTYQNAINSFLTLADKDSKIRVLGYGTIRLDIGTEKRDIENVLYVPEIADRLLSITHILDGTTDSVEFTANEVYYHKNGTKHLFGGRKGNLYYFNLKGKVPEGLPVSELDE